MSRVYFESFPQVKDFLSQAVVELCGALMCISRKIWPADSPNEESVTGEQKPRLWSSGLIRHKEADALWSMARCVKDFDGYISSSS
jgi:hypothetical protein